MKLCESPDTVIFVFLSTSILRNGQLPVAGKSGFKMATDSMPVNLNQVMAVNMESGK